MINKLSLIDRIRYNPALGPGSDSTSISTSYPNTRSSRNSINANPDISKRSSGSIVRGEEEVDTTSITLGQSQGQVLSLLGEPPKATTTTSFHTSNWRKCSDSSAPSDGLNAIGFKEKGKEDRPELITVPGLDQTSNPPSYSALDLNPAPAPAPASASVPIPNLAQPTTTPLSMPATVPITASFPNIHQFGLFSFNRDISIPLQLPQRSSLSLASAYQNMKIYDKLQNVKLKQQSQSQSQRISTFFGMKKENNTSASGGGKKKVKSHSSNKNNNDKISAITLAKRLNDQKNKRMDSQSRYNNTLSVKIDNHGGNSERQLFGENTSSPRSDALSNVVPISKTIITSSQSSGQNKTNQNQDLNSNSVIAKTISKKERARLERVRDEQTEAAKRRGLTLEEYLRRKGLKKAKAQAKNGGGTRKFFDFSELPSSIQSGVKPTQTPPAQSSMQAQKQRAKPRSYQRQNEEQVSSNIQTRSKSSSTQGEQQTQVQTKRMVENLSPLHSFLKVIETDREIQNIFKEHQSSPSISTTQGEEPRMKFDLKFRLYKRLGEIVDKS